MSTTTLKLLQAPLVVTELCKQVMLWRSHFECHGAGPSADQGQGQEGAACR